MSERPSFPCLIVLNASIIRARQEVAHAQANWSRTRGRHACSAIDSRGPEEWAVAIVLVSILSEKHIIETKKHIDESAESSVAKKSSVAIRGSNGRIKRSASARADFMRRTGYPKGRKGYVVDHIIPLECGGADIPSNMQWQTVQEAKIKDRSERNCRRE